MDNNLIAEYNLEPFSINVQSAERTLIDKLYALGDYYLSNAVQEHSRHIYDIYKLLEIVELNEDLRVLTKEVYDERTGVKKCAYEFFRKPLVFRKQQAYNICIIFIQCNEYHH